MLTICIVEDTGSIRKRLAARVEAMKDVSLLATYANAEEAFIGLQRLRPSLTILDIGLPKMTGTELLAKLLAEGYSGDFIMFTVFDHDEHLFRALELGASGYVLKEERAAGVQAAIENYRAGGAPMSPAIAKRVLQSFQKPQRLSETRVETLTERQNEILHLVANGLLNKEIAERLKLTEGTVKQHIHRIYQKMSVNNRAEAVRLYLNTN